MRKVKVLIADDEEILRDIVEMILDSEINADFIKAENGDIAAKILKEQTDIDIIISDYTMPVKNGGYLYLENIKIGNVPFILVSGGCLSDYPDFSDFKVSNPLNSFIEKPYDETKLITIVKSVLSNIVDIAPAILQIPVTAPEELIKIKLVNFIRYAKDANDVFINIGPNRFVKISDETPDSKIGKEILQHYLAKNIEYIYVNKSALTKLISDYQNNLSKSTKPEDKIELAGQVFHMSISCLESMGMSQGQIEQTNEIISETMNDFLKSNPVMDKYKKVFENEGYIVGHSMLIIYIASAIIKHSQLIFDTTIKKISLAAIVHDITLLDDKLAEEELNDDFENNSTKKKILSHVIDAANLLTSTKDHFEDTRKIVLDHHEKPNGKGFPKGLTASQFSILSSLFNLCHDIAVVLIKNNYSNEKLKEYLINEEKYYSKGNFEKFYKIALEKLV